MPYDELLRAVGVVVITSVCWSAWSAFRVLQQICRRLRREVPEAAAEPVPEPEAGPVPQVAEPPQPRPEDHLGVPGYLPAPRVLEEDDVAELPDIARPAGVRPRGSSSSSASRGPGAWRQNPLPAPSPLPHWYGEPSRSSGKRWYSVVSSNVCTPGVYRGWSRFIAENPRQVPGGYLGTWCLEDAVSCFLENRPQTTYLKIFL